MKQINGLVIRIKKALKITFKNSFSAFLSNFVQTIYIMKTIIFSVCALLVFNATILKAQKKITFTAADGLTITANLYLVNDTMPYIVLCHQAGYSRGEYNETAPKFSRFGYNCIAVDARSGKEVNDVENRTARAAMKANKPITYLDAEQDILAAIDYAYEKSKKKVLLVGSSYSASLALKIGTTNNKVKAVIAFSPGEYFEESLNLKEAIKVYTKPLFVTSTKDEAADVTKLIKDIKTPVKHQFIPIEQGAHGSKALWKVTSNHNEYWLALFMFMRAIR